MLAASALVPACVAAAHTTNVADAAHDEAVVRALGLGWTGLMRGLDAAVTSAFMLLPIGTRAARAGLASALLAGLAGAALYGLTRRLLEACVGQKAPRFGAAVAAVAALTASLGPAWLLESTAPGGAILGALLILAPLLALTPRGEVTPSRLPLAGALVGLALSYEPLAGLSALVSCAALLALGRPSGEIAWRTLLLRALAAASVGALPLLFAAGRALRSGGLSLRSGPLAAWAGEGVSGATRGPLAFLHEDVGWVLGIFGVAGVLLAAIVPRARPVGAALVAIVATGLTAIALGAPCGPSRFAAPVLAAFGAIAALAGVALQAVVRGVARARIPFARASAAMVVVLQVTLPVQFADEALGRAADRERGGAALWDDTAWGPLAPGAIVLVSDPPIMTRVVSAAAAGSLRADVTFLPSYDLSHPLARRALIQEPRLAPFWRDLTLVGSPEEFALSSLAAERPLAVVYDPKWERTLARHLVPVGLVASFEPEPRGVTDRRAALDRFLLPRNRLAQLLGETRDTTLLDATTRLLRARSIALAATGEKDVAARGAEDLRAFAPDEPAVAPSRVAVSPVLRVTRPR